MVDSISFWEKNPLSDSNESDEHIFPKREEIFFLIKETFSS